MSVKIQKAAQENWRFSRLGGFDQVELSSGSDLAALPELDQKLWAALSCPTSGLNLDEQTLAYLDTDGDGRVRVGELIAALSWVGRVLKNPSEILQKKTFLPLAVIDDSDPEGAKILSSAQEILKNIGKPEAGVLYFADVADLSRIFADTRFNGDGVITPKASEDSDLRQVMQDIMQCCGEVMDRCGEVGIDQKKIEEFFSLVREYAEWQQRGEPLGKEIASLPVGSEQAVVLVSRLKAKFDDFYTRCQLAEFDERAVESLNPPHSWYEQLTGKDISALNQELATLPVAIPAAGKGLPLHSGLNPAWRDWVLQLNSEVLTPMFGEQQSLSYRQWQVLVERFAEYRQWLAEKPLNALGCLSDARILELYGSGLQERLLTLLERDLAVTADAENIDAVRKLLHYYRDLSTLLNNFVNFRDFYTSKPHAIFQAGVLYMDGRSCQLCVRVDHVEKHAALAALGRMYIAYCECKRLGGREIMTIAAAFTGGDSENLMIGRNGVFYDREGQDWDATIIKIIDHPISIAQAFWGPYKSIARLIGTQLEKSAASRDKAGTENAVKGIVATGEKAQEGKGATTAFDVGKFAGILAAVGLAIGAIGTMLASLFSGLMSLQWWQVPLALCGLLMLISGPAMLIAFLKLRRRNLAPILDACGWAVNGKAYINIPFGRLLTGAAELPKNAKRALADPFESAKVPWRSYLLLAVVVLLTFFLVWKRGTLLSYDRSVNNVAPHEKMASPTTPETQKGEATGK